jgi:hypothetical protein
MQTIEHYDTSLLPETIYSFLMSLNGPTMIKLAGEQPGCIVVTTLLHANEPSGLRVLHRLLNLLKSVEFRLKS